MAEKLFKVLLDCYKTPALELKYNNAFELLIATILAAQTKDERVNKVMREIFKHFKSPEDFLAPNAKCELEKITSSINFYRKKTETIINSCKRLVEKYGGAVPKDVEELASFPGIGRKTASMVIANAYNVPAVFVDTHVLRTSQRIGLTTSEKPDIVENDIKTLLPEKLWKDMCLLLMMHGKHICHSKKPECTNCPIKNSCKFYNSGGATPQPD